MSYNNLTRKALARLFVPLALAWLPASGYAAGVGASAPPSFNGPSYERPVKADPTQDPRVKVGKVVASPARSAEDITVEPPYTWTWNGQYGSYWELHSNQEAQIYYTFDESWSNWTPYENPGILINEEVINEGMVRFWAKAELDGYESDVVEFEYWVRVSDPYTNPESWSKVQPGDEIKLLCDTPRAVIHYYIHGVWDSQEYDPANPLIVEEEYISNGQFKITSWATREGYDGSWRFDFDYIVNIPGVVMPPYSNINSGTYIETGTEVWLNCATEGAKIYYTFDGSQENWTPYYYDGITLNKEDFNEGSVTIWAKAELDGVESDVVDFTYYERLPRVTAIPENGTTIALGDKIELFCENGDAQIYYILNYDWENEYEYNAAEGIIITEDIISYDQVYITAYAKLDGYGQSEYTYLYYNVATQPQGVAEPTASIESMSAVNPGTQVELHCEEGDYILYKTDYDADWTGYNGPISIEEDLTIWAKAARYINENEIVESQEISFTYKIVLPPTANPMSGSTVKPGDIITLSCDTPEAEIYYTFDYPQWIPYDNAGIPVNESDATDGTISFYAYTTLPGYSAYNTWWFEYTLENQEQPQVATPIALINGYETTGGLVAYDSYVELSCDTPDAQIWYWITDNQGEWTGEFLYEGPIQLSQYANAYREVGISFSATRDGYETSETNYYSFILEEQQQVAMPEANVPSGEVAIGTAVTFTCATEGAEILYNINDTDWYSYTDPIIINEDMTIQVKATYAGYEPSYNEFTYTVKWPAEPTASIPSGTTVAAGTSVDLFCEDGATIWYTLDGLSPYESETVKIYSEPIVITETTTICAVAILNGYGSGVAEFTYHVQWIPTQDQASKPTASIPSGTAVEAGTEVELSCETPGAQIWYTTDGSNPRNSETRVLYEKPIVIEETVTIRSVATIDGYYDSMVAEFRYRVKEPAAKPEASLPQESEVDAGTSVELTSESEGAEIWYTLDGTSPITSETRMRYEQGIVIYEETTILAVAIGEDYLNSEVAEYHYTVKTPSGIYGVTGDKLTVATLPGGNGFQVAGVNGRSVVVYVFDTTGKAAMPNREVSEDTVIPMDNCAPGVYVVKAMAADEVATLKLNLR